MMNGDERTLEVKVGLFTIMGLLICGGLLVYFGRVQEPFKNTYTITVHFPNASGLQQGAHVLMGGARIGRVATSPEIPPDRDGVVVDLRIYEENQIPRGSQFRVRTTGLMGDAYVDVWPKKGKEVTGFIQPEDIIRGEREGGLGEVAQSGTELMENLAVTNEELKKLLIKINNDVLSEEFIAHLHNMAAGASDFADVLKERGEPSMETLQASLENFRKTSENLVTVSRDFQTTSKKLDVNADQLGQILTEIDQAVETAQAALNDAREGDGPLPALLGDEKSRQELQQAIDNLHSFSLNIKRHGVLFYKDTAVTTTPPKEDEAAPAPEEPNRTQPRAPRFKR